MKHLHLPCILSLLAFTAGPLSAQEPPEAPAGCPRDSLHLNEILYSSANGATQFVEIRNRTDVEVDLPGVTIVAGALSYTIPATVTGMMGNDDYVLVLFDGADPATDDVSFDADNKVVLHGPMQPFLGDPVGHCALYRAAGVQSAQLLLDFVAWGGEPGDAANLAVDKGIWPGQQIHLLTDPANPPDGPGFIPVNPGDVICRSAEGNWQVCKAADASPGAPNEPSLDAPVLEFPNEGLAAFEAPARYWWTSVPGAEKYQIQVSTTDDFAAPVIDAEAAQALHMSAVALPGDTVVFWRVRAIKGAEQSPWSAVVSFTIGAPSPPGPAAGEAPPADDNPPADDPPPAPGGATFSVSGLVRDSLASTAGNKPPLGGVTVTINGMNAVTAANGTFTINGVPPGTHAVTLTLANYTFANNIMVTVTNANVAGQVHEGTGASHTIMRAGAGLPALGARKDTTIVATKRGATSNRMCEFANTNQQGWDRAHTQAAIANNHLESWWCWAVGIVMVNNYYGGTLTRDETVIQVRGDLLHDQDAGSNWNQYIPGLQWALQQANLTNFDVRNRGGANITNAEVKTWLDANRPLYFRRPGHIMVIDRYLYWGGNLWARFVNTDNNGSTQLWQFSTVNNGGVIAPKNAVAGNARNTQATIGMDGDGDGLNHYDEARFGTNIAMTDTDGDRVPDKAEIRSWAFPRARPNGGNVAGVPDVNKNIDGDGIDPQLDKDSDDGGIEDGDEDLNFDGVLDMSAGTMETDIYKREDDKVLDLVFVIDSTGSMGDDIAAVKASATAIVERVEMQFRSWRIAVVDYKDYPPEDNVPYRAVLPFSTNKPAIFSAINGLGASGGGDTPETLLTALTNTVNVVGLADAMGVGWRGRPGDGIKRAIIYMTDAPAHNPEPVTGYTIASTAAALVGGGLTLGDPTSPATAPGGPSPGLAPPERSGPITVYPIVVGGNSTAASDAMALADATGGEVIPSAGASGVADAIISALDDIALSPDAVLLVADDEGHQTGLLGATALVGDLSRSFDPEGCGIVLYEWDWDGDGTYDQSGPLPTARHEYGEGGFGGDLRARIVTFSGATAVASILLASDDVVEFVSVGELVLNPQTGLFEQEIVVSNPGSATIDALNLIFGSLPAGAEVRNATGATPGGDPFVHYAEDILPGATVTFVIEYYYAPRNVFAPVVSAEATTKTTVVNPAGPDFAIDKVDQLPDGSILVEFTAQPGTAYFVQYSEDGANWRTVFPALVAAANRVQWIDSGPPKTECHPSDCPGRIYRVLTPQP